MQISFAKKEREVIAKLGELSRKTVEATSTLRSFFDCYFKNECDKKQNFFKDIKRIEHEADEIRRGIISDIYKGLFLPDMREVIHSLTEGIDKIVNKCESVSKIVDYQHPNVPEHLKEKIIGQLDCAISAAEAFVVAVEKLFDNIDEVQHYVIEVERFEHNEDVIEEEVLRDIFSLQIPLAEKMQLKELVINVGDIVDRTEDASDILEVLLLKLAY
ncbi:MAG: TIGR00153 family protein [Fervidobacterium sp.]|uniref:TIGR00153 family protein n=1 Tax=Fervidobacterium sp. TaxID=1871331 RepID=UPI0040492638